MMAISKPVQTRGIVNPETMSESEDKKYQNVKSE